MGIGALISGVASFLGSGTAAAAIAGAAIKIVAAVGISSLLQKKIPKPGVAARTLTSRGTVDPQQIIYGEALVAGSLAYRNAHGNNNSQLWAVHCLAGHECESILDVYLDSRQITNSIINGGAAAGGGVDSGTFAPTRGTVNTVEIWKHLGTSSQTANSALVTASSDWTSSHRLRGICYAVTMFKLNDKTEKVWEAGDPSNVKFLVRGKKVYDPRLETAPGANPDSGSYIAWSDNPALCLADYLRDSKFSPFAGGIEADRIDWNEVAAAADDCDTLVSVPSGTEKRFTCNGVLYGTASGAENVEALLSSMNGSLVFTGGKYVIRAGVYDSPSDSIDEDDIIGPVGITSALDSEKRVNTMKATYIDSAKEYEPTETAPISVAAYKTTRDGGDELIQTIELPMTNSNTEAQRICLKRLYEADEELTLTVPCNLRAMRLVPGERVNLTIEERGWSPKVFKVLDWEQFDRGGDDVGVNVTLREDQSGAYADPDSGDYNTISPGGALTLADPVPVPSVDSIPHPYAGHYGEGTWNIELTMNETTSGADDGEVKLDAGTYILPDGTTRELSADTSVFTPYEGAEKPPDGRFYIVWGATDPETRFSASPGSWGQSVAETAGMFAAIYDRINYQWYAVDNDGNEYEFTPLSTDYIVATGTKTSASGGIDSLTSLVSRMGAKIGDSVYSSLGALLGDIDLRNDQLVIDALGSLNPNPGFQIPRVGPLGDPAPASWWGFNDPDDTIQYDNPDEQDVLFFPATTSLRCLNAAFPVSDALEYTIRVMARDDGGNCDIIISICDTTENLASGERAIYPFTYNGLGGDDDESIIHNSSGAAHQPIVDQALTSTFTVYEFTYTPDAGVKWASLLLDAGDNFVDATSDNVYVEWAIISIK